MKQLFTLLLSMGAAVIFAQQPNTKCVCCTSQHSQFDFWVGNWQVTDTAGNVLGTNLVEKHYDKCIVQENWKSTKVNRGTSFNHYQPIDSTWNQLWLDNQGSILNLKGKWNGNAMVLRSELQQAKSGNTYYNQISWTPKPNGTVVQLWVIFDEKGNKLRELFRGIYTPK